MSFSTMNIISGFGPNFDERRWLHQIRKYVDDELEDETVIPITIFSVPKALIVCSPDYYIPQQVAIGPYHHFQPEVYDMERYKVAAARSYQRELHNTKLQDVVEHLVKFELLIRAGYDRPVGFGPEALAWLMTVDACFLLEFFAVCGLKTGKVLTKNHSTLSRLTDLSTNKNVHDAIIRDVMMLDNQIPLFVMRMLLEFQLLSLDHADRLLLDMLIALGHEVSPFKMDGMPQIEAKECTHLLDFLYRLIVPKLEVGPNEIIEIREEERDGNKEMENMSSFSEHRHLSELLRAIWHLLSDGPLEWVKSIIHSKPLQVLVQFPWTLLTKIPIPNRDEDKKGIEQSSSNNNNNNSNKPPLSEEIKIPSVSQLSQVGVQFTPTNEGITGINFDSKTRIFHLPVIELDTNSEFVLRNLVAYETCVKGPLVLTRFVELMHGVIDTDEDVRMLCERGIIVNHLNCEKKAAEMFNGMSGTIGLTKVGSLDKVIGEVNGYYNGRWKVRVDKLMRRYVYGSWKVLTFVAAVMMLLLMFLQAFCEVYSCSRLVRIQALDPLKYSF